MNHKEDLIAGRNAVIEALRAKKPIDKIFVLDGCQDGPIRTIVREAKKTDAILKFVDKERLNQLTNEHHQGVVAIVAAYEYGTIEDLFKRAEEKGEDPFFILLDGIEDPHNLGAIIRTANLAGAHGVIIPKHRAVGITPTVAKTSAGAINYTPVVKVTNIGKTMDELKERGMWFACADMDGEVIYRQNLTGSIGLVIGNEGSGVSRLVKEKCDFISSIPMKGDIDSLNASVAAGVRQIQSGNDDAMECLLERYRDMVRKEARSFFLAGGDEEDLIQEGMIGLFKAVTSYQEEKNTSFSTFAYLCVQRQIYTTITAFNRKKHIPLNTAISLFEQKNQEEELSLDEILETPEETPEEMMLRKEELNDYYKMLDQNLSKFEKQVMYHYLNGETYTTIAKKLGKSDKSIDNAIQRIRRKIRNDQES